MSHIKAEIILVQALKPSRLILVYANTVSAALLLNPTTPDLCLLSLEWGGQMSNVEAKGQVHLRSKVTIIDCSSLWLV